MIHFDQLNKLALGQSYNAAETFASPCDGRRSVAVSVLIYKRTGLFLHITVADDIAAGVVFLLVGSNNFRPMTEMKTVKSTLLDKLREIISQIGGMIERRNVRNKSVNLTIFYVVYIRHISHIE